jgi:hypothetical protein
MGNSSLMVSGEPTTTTTTTDSRSSPLCFIWPKSCLLFHRVSRCKSITYQRAIFFFLLHKMCQSIQATFQTRRIRNVLGYGHGEIVRKRPLRYLEFVSRSFLDLGSFSKNSFESVLLFH